MTKASECAEFRAGQVWKSPRGTFYNVQSVQIKDGIRQALLRQGIMGSGRKMVRDVAKTEGWSFVAPLATSGVMQQAMEGKL